MDGHPVINREICDSLVLGSLTKLQGAWSMDEVVIFSSSPIRDNIIVDIGSNKFKLQSTPMNFLLNG